MAKRLSISIICVLVASTLQFGRKFPPVLGGLAGGLCQKLPNFVGSGLDRRVCAPATINGTATATVVNERNNRIQIQVEGSESSSSDAKPLLVLSYSLYGANSKYVRGMIETAKLARRTYPGWQVRVYHDTTVPLEDLSELSKLGSSVMLVNVTADLPDWVGRDVNPRAWRFLVASDPTVRAYGVRDSDSRLSVREKAAVDEWLISGKAVHIMRDHPAHDPDKDPMLAGMWGGLHRAVPNMDSALREYYSTRSGFKYEDDQDFLRQRVFLPLTKADALQHDSYFCKKSGGIAFPMTREQSGDPNDFVGRQQIVLGNKVVPTPVDMMLKDARFSRMYNDCIRMRQNVNNVTRNALPSDTSYRGKLAGSSVTLSATGDGGGEGRKDTRLRGKLQMVHQAHSFSTSSNPANSSRGTSHNSFEQHYLSVYRSMILLKEVPPKFVLWRMSPTSGLGFGNRIRSLNGAIFLAAVSDRVLLVEESNSMSRSHWGGTFSSLFLPPIVGGVELDWNASLARGACDSKETSASIPQDTRAIFKDFDRTYGNLSCIVVSASHGIDRQVAPQNEANYKDKVVRLFGSTSRFNWSRYTLGLVMQRPRPAILRTLTSALRSIELLDGVPTSHRIALQFRTFYDLWGHDKEEVLASSPKFWDCAVRLVQKRIAALQVLPAAKPSNVTVLFASDSSEMKKMAKNRLGSLPGCSVVDLGLPVVHTGKRVGESRNFMNTFVEWLMIGECGTVIATGASSFAITAFFRPSLLPPVETSSKLLFTIDGIRSPGGGNLQCGQVQPHGYSDLNFGFHDGQMLV